MVKNASNLLSLHSLQRDFYMTYFVVEHLTSCLQFTDSKIIISIKQANVTDLA